MEVIEMENEGVIAASGGLNGFEDAEMFSRSRSTGSKTNYNAASFSELEDAINDILTFEE